MNAKNGEKRFAIVMTGDLLAQFLPHEHRLYPHVVSVYTLKNDQSGLEAWCDEFVRLAVPAVVHDLDEHNSLLVQDLIELSSVKMAA